VAATPGGRVLDVGCGTGATTLAAARVLGARGRCTGVDLSEPMLALARERAARAGLAVDFVRGDAQTEPLGEGAFDLIMSRFGVMFFADPVAAFANLRRAAAPGGRLLCIVWRSPAENPFMTTAERAAAPLLPALPPRVADGPGQFAFAEADRVRRILDESGWQEAGLQAIDVPCTLPARHLLDYAGRLGPVGRFLESADEKTRTEVDAIVRAAFAPYVHGDEVRYVAACWSVTARTPR
jgi:SAM-dependent methyltransferase